MLTPELEDKVRTFARGDGYLAHPDGAENMCGTITYTFTERLRKHNLLEGWQWLECHRAQEIARPAHIIDYKLSHNHVCLIYRVQGITFTGRLIGTVVDFTARQYWPTSPFPLIEPLEDYARRFASVQLRSPGQHCSGPSRIGRKDKMRIILSAS